MQQNIKHYEQYIGLILFCVNKHFPTTTVTHWDMLQAGYKGLAKAIQKYDGRIPFKNWAYIVINSEIITNTFF